MQQHCLDVISGTLTLTHVLEHLGWLQGVKRNCWSARAASHPITSHFTALPPGYWICCVCSHLARSLLSRRDATCQEHEDVWRQAATAALRHPGPGPALPWGSHVHCTSGTEDSGSSTRCCWWVQFPPTNNSGDDFFSPRVSPGLAMLLWAPEAGGPAPRRAAGRPLPRWACCPAARPTTPTNIATHHLDIP